MFETVRRLRGLPALAIFIAAAGVIVPRGAASEPYSASFVLEYKAPGNAGGDQFRVSLASRCLGDAIIYKIKNEGVRWPGQVNLAFFREGERAPLIFRDMLLDEGQIATFRIYTEQPYPVIDMRIKAPWLDQRIFHRSRHRPPRDGSGNGRRKTGKVFKRHLSYIQK